MTSNEVFPNPYTQAEEMLSPSFMFL
jgi:hypothetical protein